MKTLVQVSVAAAAAIMLGTAQEPAPAGAFMLEQALSYPFPDHLVASNGPSSRGRSTIRLSFP
jgi:hypothetical protein